MCLAAAGAPFTDKFIDKETWATIKSEPENKQHFFPCNLPVMVMDGTRYFESKAILRLAGAKMGFYNSKDSKTSFAAD